MERVHRIVYEYQWAHLVTGILGNCLFIAGSVLFMQELQPLAIYCFIAGSSAMLIGNLGSAVVKLWQARAEREAERAAS